MFLTENIKHRSSKCCTFPPKCFTIQYQEWWFAALSLSFTKYFLNTLTRKTVIMSAVSSPQLPPCWVESHSFRLCLIQNPVSSIYRCFVTCMCVWQAVQDTLQNPFPSYHFLTENHILLLTRGNMAPHPQSSVFQPVLIWKTAHPPTRKGLNQNWIKLDWKFALACERMYRKIQSYQ